MQKIVGWVLLVLLFLNVSAAAQDDMPVLDLVVALDVSGSMNRDATGSTLDAVDSAWRKLREIGDIDFNATDATGERFALTEMLLEWLAAYASNRTSIEINASVVTFANTSVLMDWTRLQRRNDDRLLDPLDRSATQVAEAQNSDFIALYQTLGNLFNESDSSANARRVVLLITDSIPCLPTGIRDASAPRYDRFCEDVPAMIRHINGLTELSNTGEYILFVNPISEAQRWTPFPGLRDAWVDRVSSDGAFTDLNSINELPAAMMNAVMREIAMTSDLTTGEESPANDPLSPAVYSRMGIAYAPNGRWNVGPYQTEMQLLAVMSDSGADLTFTNDAASNVLYESGEESLRIVRVERPDPGSWGVQPAGVVWAMFSSGQARISLQPENPTRFVPQRLVYEIVDESGTSLEITEETTPDFQITVRSSDNTESSDLSAMELAADGQSLISPPFLPMTPDTYTLDIQVSPGTGELWQLAEDTNYLVPDNVQPIQVAGMTFSAEFDVIEPENSHAVGEVSTTAVTLPRSVPLGVEVKATMDNGEEISLPEGISAQVNITPAGGSVCPPGRDMNIDPDTRDSATALIQFDEGGECRVEVALSITSSLQPLSGESSDVRVVTPARQVTITPTERLSLRLVGDNGEIVSQDMAEPAYQIIDRNSTPLQWDFNSVTLRLEIVNEDGEPVSPEFAEFNQEAGDRQHCLVQTNRNLAEATADPSGSVSPSTNDNRIVPVRLQITLNEQDVARERGICFYATDTPGVYLANVTGLTAGDYIVRASIERGDPPLDLTRFEYAPNLFSDTSTSAEVTALLKVDYNPAMVIQIGAAAGFTALTGLGIVAAFTRYSAARIAPLRIDPAIYRVPKSLASQPSDNLELDSPLEALWTGKVRRLHTYTFESTEFLRNPDLALLDIQHLTFTTDRSLQLSNQRAARANIRIKGGDPLMGEVLVDKTARQIAEDQRAYYYITNGLKPVSARMLLKSSGRIG
jgi:hypothetical protein